MRQKELEVSARSIVFTVLFMRFSRRDNRPLDAYPSVIGPIIVSAGTPNTFRSPFVYLPTTKKIYIYMYIKSYGRP